MSVCQAVHQYVCLQRSCKRLEVSNAAVLQIIDKMALLQLLLMITELYL